MKTFFFTVEWLNDGKNYCPKTMMLPRIHFEVENKSWRWGIPSMPTENRNKNLQIFTWRYNKIPTILEIVPSVTVIEILLN